jgi:hypothetical protein
MEWTLCRFQPQEPELLDYYFLAAGKALCVANNFEGTCKYILKMFTLADALEVGNDFDAAKELAKRLEEKMLGQAINVLGGMPDMEPGDLDILRAAKDSRNYVAHEGVALGCLYYVRTSSILKLIDVLREHVVNLAKGENLVSKWSYEICEKEPASFADPDRYAQDVLDWIFVPGHDGRVIRN